MSLIHFTITNPGWKPSGDSEKYLTGLRHCAEKDVQQLATLDEQEQSSASNNPMYDSISALNQLGGSYRQ